ncbi:MAG: Omp28-related outer membrane protein, partial [Bacteroidetes bacterium]|nr:Omp28-related outer membrane protein [Bacteroidota bacterium]
IEFLTDMEGTYNLCFYIAESGIIAPQKNDNSNYGHVPDILDYEHNHVLRTSVWGAWGTEVVSAGISQGETVTEYPSVTIHNDWVTDNCTVIAFIYNTETYNIIQAEETAMIEY